LLAELRVVGNDRQLWQRAVQANGRAR
jgi:hypothetical protein